MLLKKNPEIQIKRKKNSELTCWQTNKCSFDTKWNNIEIYWNIHDQNDDHKNGYKDDIYSISSNWTRIQVGAKWPKWYYIKF